LLETYRQADGSIVLPDALAAYMGGNATIAATAS
jgi:seryl-tRNA synthetase